MACVECGADVEIDDEDDPALVPDADDALCGPCWRADRLAATAGWNG